MDLQSSWPPAHAAALRILADEPWTPAAVRLAVERVEREATADARVDRETRWLNSGSKTKRHAVSHMWVVAAPIRREQDAAGRKGNGPWLRAPYRRREHGRCLAARGVTQVLCVGSDKRRSGSGYQKRIHGRLAQAVSFGRGFLCADYTDRERQSPLEGEWRDTQWVRWEDIYHCLQAEGQRAEACALLWATAMRA